MEDDVFVKAGKLFCFSSGEYSDYGYEGHFLALVDINQALFQRIVDEIKADINEGKHELYGKKVTAESDDYEKQCVLRDQFMPRLVRQGVILDIDCTEIYLGSYGRLELEGVEV